MTDSPAVEFIQYVWSHAQKATGHSWLKLNHALRHTLDLAIKSGMRFYPDDFEKIAKRFRSGYWIGADPEWVYTTAVLYRNSSAYQSWEHHRGRKPFIFSASISTDTGDGPCGQGLARLVVNAEFKWKGLRVKVTSFNDEKGYVNAACYDGPEAEGVKCPACDRYTTYPERTPGRRFKITHADIRAAKKALRPTPDAGGAE